MDDLFIDGAYCPAKLMRFNDRNHLASGVRLLSTLFSSSSLGTALTGIRFVALVTPGVIAGAQFALSSVAMVTIAVCWFLNVSIHLDIQH